MKSLVIFSGFLEVDECTPFVGPNSAVVKIDWRCARFSSTLLDTYDQTSYDLEIAI